MNNKIKIIEKINSYLEIADNSKNLNEIRKNAKKAVLLITKHNLIEEYRKTLKSKI